MDGAFMGYSLGKIIFPINGGNRQELRNQFIKSKIIRIIVIQYNEIK